jgi:hypothetical protein
VTVVNDDAVIRPGDDRRFSSFNQPSVACDRTGSTQ